jgi:hypothetical protein
LASDNAADSAYNDGWLSGDNGGTGFSAWTLNSSAPAGGFAGFFIQSSAADGFGNIDTAGESFGMAANPGGAFATATRSFLNGALATLQQFSLQLAVNFRNGQKGFDLTGSSGQVFNFNVGGDLYQFTVAGSPTQTLPFAYQADSVFSISFTQQAGTTVDVSIVRTSGAGGTESFSNSFAFGGPINSFQFYVSNTEGGAANNLYFNNLAVTAIPEPSTISLLGAAALFGGCFYARRRKH